MKKTINLKLALVVGVSLLALFIFGGCTQNSRRIITISGSTSIQPIAEELADAFTEADELNNDIRIDVQGGGSTQGIKDVSEGTSHIGTSSRDLMDDEKALNLTEHIIAHDGISIVIHPDNPVENLTKDQIAKIFKGEIKNWQEVGGSDMEILVVSREEGSGTRSAFEEILKLEKKEGNNKISLVRPDALIADGTGAIKANIAVKKNAIGYTSLGFVDNSLKAVKVDGVECTSDNIKSKDYSISRPFIMLTKGEMSPEVKVFIDFIMGSEGQEIISKQYISVK